MHGNPAASGRSKLMKRMRSMTVAPQCGRLTWRRDSYGACMKICFFVFVAGMALGADKRLLPGQAGNDDIELTGSVIIDRDEIHQALGADLGAGYVVARMKATPKTEQPLRISP